MPNSSTSLAIQHTWCQGEEGLQGSSIQMYCWQHHTVEGQTQSIEVLWWSQQHPRSLLNFSDTMSIHQYSWNMNASRCTKTMSSPSWTWRWESLCSKVRRPGITHTHTGLTKRMWHPLQRFMPGLISLELYELKLILVSQGIISNK